MPNETRGGLFGDLPTFPPPLPDDELRLLAVLPLYGAEQAVAEIAYEDEAACRRLEVRGLVKVHRWKDDPIAIRRTMYAGRLYASTVRELRCECGGPPCQTPPGHGCHAREIEDGKF